MESLFAPYKIALELKKLGFDEPCFGYWKSKNWLIQEKTRTDGYTHADQECSAPLYQQAFRWFREKYQASPTIHCMSEQGNSWKYHIPNEGGERDFNTYEEAELACLIKLIEICKKYLIV